MISAWSFYSRHACWPKDQQGQGDCLLLMRFFTTFCFVQDDAMVYFTLFKIQSEMIFRAFGENVSSISSYSFIAPVSAS